MPEPGVSGDPGEGSKGLVKKKSFTNVFGHTLRCEFLKQANTVIFTLKSDLTLSYVSNETIFRGTLETNCLNSIVIYYNIVELFQCYNNFSRCK